MASPNQIFETVAVKEPPRSYFNLSHTWKSTVDFAYLIPNLVLDVVPGDVVKCNTNIFIRAMALFAPIMHAVDIYQHYFYVPDRLVWDNYDKFYFEQKNETAETIPIRPYLLPPDGPQSAQELWPLWRDVGSLADYMGLPLWDARTQQRASDEDVTLCSLPFRGYQLIYNDYFRDENLMPEIEINKGDGLESTEDMLKIMQIRKRCWEKDYFTSALTQPQMGNAVGFGVDAGSLRVQLDPGSLADPDYIPRIVTPDGATTGLAALNKYAEGGISGPLFATSNGQNYGAYLDPSGSLIVTGNNYVTIEQLRQQMRLQEMKELLNRGGHRYNEVVRNLYGVIPDDLRIGRPSYLGGGKQNLVISEVLQQSQSTTTTALGEGAGHAISVGSDNRFRCIVKEHGYIFGIMSIRPRAEYAQGVDKHWLKRDRYDFLNPKFAHLGEQPVYNGELFFDYYDGKNREGFGYQPVFEEYRNKPSSVHGAFRNSLAFWTLARRFASRPNLNANFVEMNPDTMNTIFAVTEASDGSHFACEVEHNLHLLRRLPKSGIPTL